MFQNQFGPDKKQSLAQFTRSATARLLTDSITNSSTMYSPEACNLLVYSSPTDATRAESFYSAPMVQFPCRLLRAEFDRTREPLRVKRMSIEGCGFDAALTADVSNFSGQIYGLRSAHEAIWEASPYEVFLYWYPRRATFPRSLKDDKSGKFHCRLTEAGIEHCTTNGFDCEDSFLPGIHYHIASNVTHGRANGEQWIPLHVDAPGTYRHTIVLARHDRPRVPWFAYPYERDSNLDSRAKAKLAYFSPWTCIESAQTRAVPYARTIKTDSITYKDAWKDFLKTRLPCETLWRYISSFETIHETATPTCDPCEDENDHEDTTRLGALSAAELHTTSNNGVPIDVRVWRKSLRRAQGSTQAPPSALVASPSTRQARDFLNGQPVLQQTRDAGFRRHDGRVRNMYDFYTNFPVKETIIRWRDKRAADTSIRRVAEQERFLLDVNKALAAFNRAAQALVGLFGLQSGYCAYIRAVVLTFGLFRSPAVSEGTREGDAGAHRDGQLGRRRRRRKEKNTTMGLAGFEYCRRYC